MTRLTLLAAALLAATSVLAHGPTPQRERQSVTVPAPPETVWRLVGDPARFAEWHPHVRSSEIQGDGPGTTRTVVFSAGGTVIDGIDIVNDEEKAIRWRLAEEDATAIPVSYYTNDIKVTPADEGSEVTWSASFFRADTTNYPGTGFDDTAATEAMQRFISDGLQGLGERVSNGDLVR